MKLIRFVVKLIIIGCLLLFGINTYVVLSIKSNIKKEPKQEADAILILGAAVWEDGPSPMLKERLDTGIELYKKGLSKKIIMSGDNTKINYDEVNAMKSYAINNGVPSEDIFMDHAGISTYDSIYRSNYIFKAKSLIIVTQNYHLYRSLYIARSLNIKAIGVPSNKQEFTGKYYREGREVLARNKDFIKCIIKPKSKFLGEEIPVTGNGDITNDK